MSQVVFFIYFITCTVNVLFIMFDACVNWHGGQWLSLQQPLIYKDEQGRWHLFSPMRSALLSQMPKTSQASWFTSWLAPPPQDPAQPIPQTLFSAAVPWVATRPRAFHPVLLYQGYKWNIHGSPALTADVWGGFNKKEQATEDQHLYSDWGLKKQTNIWIR